MKEVENGTIKESNIYISTDKPYEIDDLLEENKELTREYIIHGENLYQERNEEGSLKKLVTFILYIVDIMITVFCMTNIFYIISSSTIFRKKDFAVLRSIGMTERQIDKMLLLEGILYGFSGIVFGTIFSFGFLYLLGKYTIDKELYLFKLPFIQVIYAIILVYVIIFLAIIVARHRVKKKNIMDEIRRENI